MLLIAPIEEIHCRTMISRASLEEKITNAVKVDDACEAFVGVIVERLRGRSSLDEANWSIKGIRFGRTDRDKAGPVVDEVVEGMQGLYNLSDDHPRD